MEKVMAQRRHELLNAGGELQDREPHRCRISTQRRRQTRLRLTANLLSRKSMMKRATMTLGAGFLAGLAEAAYGVAVESDLAVVFLAGLLAFALVFALALGVLCLLSASRSRNRCIEAHRDHLWREWMSTPAGTIGSEADREYHRM